MKLSVIIGTRNRSFAIKACIQSIGQAIVRAGLGDGDAEIIIVDNGSTDDTAAIVSAMAGSSSIPVHLLLEPQTGVMRACNRGVRRGQGDLFVFTDDDCQMDEAYIVDLLAHDSADSDLVIRGGRIELGDPRDLPLTIKTDRTAMTFSLKLNSARKSCLSGQISGCNMTFRRSVYERLGPFDERFGPGAIIGSGGDTDYIYRAYLAGIRIEYVPDMAVYHFHGRRDKALGHKVLQRYMIANGALLAKYFWRHPNLFRSMYWDFKHLLKDAMRGRNTYLPDIGFSRADQMACYLRGFFRYLLFAQGNPHFAVPADQAREKPLEPGSGKANG
ncbi:MAG: glycosyltransferase family 2 protein [Pseudomonadota bacterium]|nr:glycosyltransferase family 2 protein [Pseudomonadota bacterium]